jgi:hypothetical protein
MYNFPVFVDRSGNRFIFPGLYSSETHDRTVSWSQCISIQCALGVTQEKENFVVDSSGYEYVSSDAMSSGFAHGGTTVHLIGGPLFDEVKLECATEAENKITEA